MPFYTLDDMREGGKNVFRTDYVGKARTIAPQSSITLTRHLFAGAKELDLLKAYQKDPGIPYLDEAHRSDAGVVKPSRLTAL